MEKFTELYNLYYLNFTGSGKNFVKFEQARNKKDFIRITHDQFFKMFAQSKVKMSCMFVFPLI